MTTQVIREKMIRVVEEAEEEMEEVVEEAEAEEVVEEAEAEEVVEEAEAEEAEAEEAEEEMEEVDAEADADADAEEVELEEFEYKGSTYYRDTDNNVFMADEDGELVADAIGVWNPTKQRIVVKKADA
jgi:small subunit ribosomal protein S3